MCLVRGWQPPLSPFCKRHPQTFVCAFTTLSECAIINQGSPPQVVHWPRMQSGPADPSPHSLVYKHSITWSGRRNIRKQRPPQPSCAATSTEPNDLRGRLAASYAAAAPAYPSLFHSVPTVYGGRSRSSLFCGLGVVRKGDAPHGRPVTSSAAAVSAYALALPPPTALPATTSPTAVRTDFSAEAMTPAAVPWPRLKRSPPLLLPVVASSAPVHHTVVQRGLTHGGDVPPRPVLSSAAAAPRFPSPPSGSPVQGDTPHGRPRGLVHGDNIPSRRFRGLVCGCSSPLPPLPAALSAAT